MKKIIFFLMVSVTVLSCKKNTVDQAKVDRDIIRKYLADSSLAADSTASGLFYIIKSPGAGIQPNSTSYVTVNYKGYLVNGTVFDQTTGSPVSFFLNSVIPGWTEGIPFIKKSGKIKLLIPSGLGYADKTVGTIPANSVLIFDIELVNVQ